jgi:RND family efflux transporter MFP subunit
LTYRLPEHFGFLPAGSSPRFIVSQIKKSAKMKVKIIIWLYLSLLITGCSHNHEHEAQEAAPEIGNSTIFTVEQQKKVDFSLEEIGLRPFGTVIRTTAQIQPAPGGERIISAQTAGTVLFPDHPPVEGMAVRAGQTLVVVDGSGGANNDLSLRYAEAESEYRRAKAEYERKGALIGENIVSQSEWLQSQTDFLNAEAAYNRLKKNFPSGKQRIAAPVSGFITRLPVRNGQYVESGEAVVVVSQSRDLFIRAEVQTRYFEVLGDVESANIRIPDNNRIYTLESLNGRMVSYGRSVTIDQPLLPVVFRIDSRQELLPGRFVELFIKTRNREPALTVPNEAIVEEMGNYFVYVQQSPERFEKRSIGKGVTDGLRTDIRSGLSVGEIIVSQGAIFIKLAQAAGTVDVHSGHVH